MPSHHLNHILSGLPAPTLILGPDQRLMLANPAAKELLGKGLLGQLLPGVIRQPDVLAKTAKVLEGQVKATARYTSRGAVATTYLVTIALVSAEALELRAGQSGAMLSFADISHVKAAEQMRSDFVANVSHELRSPLTALSGFIETLRGPAKDDPKAQAQFLEIMEGEANRMNRLIGDLLSLSGVEASEKVRPRGKVDIAGLITATIAAVDLVAKSQNCKIEFTAEDLPPIPGDADQLTQVFHNLVENAVKYGGKSVRIVLKSAAKTVGIAGPAVRVEVVDQGDGIDPIHLPRLTERFYRVDDHRSRALGGTGLGLAIVKHIVNRHRGRLMIDSKLGQGSRFVVVLPRG